VNDFACTCPVGFVGDTCGDADACGPNPCQNGGTCANDTGGFTCVCDAGYSGATCDINIDDCASSPCSNGGACEDEVNGFSCACDPDFSGPTCAVHEGGSDRGTSKSNDEGGCQGADGSLLGALLAALMLLGARRKRCFTVA
jgi:hypothetical protein